MKVVKIYPVLLMLGALFMACSELYVDIPTGSGNGEGSAASPQYEVSAAVLGEDCARATVALIAEIYEPEAFGVSIAGEAVNVREVDLSTPGFVTITFDVPQGAEAVEAEISYSGVALVRLTVPRAVPVFSIEGNAFASGAIVTIKAETQQVAETISRYVRIYANDVLQTPVEIADLPGGSLWPVMGIKGLEPGKMYELRAEVVAGQPVAECTIVTESAEQVPFGDFEDHENVITYRGLKSGGTYSTTAFPIYNRQNTKDISVNMPKKYWSTTNAKTFCRKAKTHNTWYMMPSAALDFDDWVVEQKSLRVTTVGWSLRGVEIPPYQQRPGETLPYNANVPEVDHISAGKAFLGSYKFDAATTEEAYSEGTAFGSRPKSLNGFYKYAPVGNDRGLAIVEIVNDTDEGKTVIARGEMQFEAATNFTTFNIPLRYSNVDLKATQLRIMFSSSAAVGSIEYEDSHVPYEIDVPNAQFRGSVLWVDNLTFTY